MKAHDLTADRAAVGYLCRTMHDHADLLQEHDRITPGAADALRAHAQDLRGRLHRRLHELAQRRQAMGMIERAQTERIGATS